MLEDALLVELVDLSSVILLGLMTLNLHCICQDALGLEGLWLQVDVLCLLEALQPCFLADLSKIVDNLETNGSILAELLESALNIQFVADFLDCFLMRDCNGDHKGLSGLAMDEYFSQFIALHIGILHLFSSYILTLLQLEDVLFSVDDAQCPCLGTECSHITRLQPSVGSECLFCLGLISKVSHEDTRPSYPNFSAGSGVAFCVCIGG